ncbi:MAG TPA: hypothetical protein DCY42_04345 [Chloroflexi bacterium]|nr:hypothetical protein [Chloroflexota bacterium]
MKINKILSVSLLGVVLICALLLVGCQGTSISKSLELSNQSELAAGILLPEKEDMVAYRWNAMAQAYKKNGMLNYHANDDDLLAYRWNAMAKAYEKMGLINNGMTSDDLLAYRWDAMAQAFEKNGRLNYHANADDLLAYRWNAMAEWYLKNGFVEQP